MIDGITIKYTISDFEAWKQSTNISFGITVDHDTAEIKTKKREDQIVTTYRAKFETFDLTVKEVEQIATNDKLFYLTIKGSLHKNYYGGKNYLPFTWEQLQQQITHICKRLLISPSDAQIASLEIGVNIIPLFIVSPFLMNNIISYKGNTFNRYKKDTTGFCLGIYCSLSQYVIKIYDKGLQNDLPGNLMRFEKRFLKMQGLNKKGIKFLSDLTLKSKVENLQSQLLIAWNDVLIFDIDNRDNYKLLKNKESALLTKGRNSNFWERLKKENIRQFNAQREKFRELVAKYGNNWKEAVSDLSTNEWQRLFNNCTNLPLGENKVLYDFTIKIKGKDLQQRFCRSCGNDITNQKESSLYCSEKYVGYEAAHRCRNTNNNRKYKIEKINRRGVLFDITPYFINSKQICKN